MERSVESVKEFLVYSWDNLDLLMKRDPVVLEKLQSDVAAMSVQEIALLEDVMSEMSGVEWQTDTDRKNQHELFEFTR